MSIGIIIKGNKHDVVVIGATLAEAEGELKRHKTEILTFCDSANPAEPVSRRASSKKTSIPISIMELKSEGFFDQPKNWNDIQKALEERGYVYPLRSLTNPLQGLVRKRELGRMKKDNKWHYVKR